MQKHWQLWDKHSADTIYGKCNFYWYEMFRSCRTTGAAASRVASAATAPPAATAVTRAGASRATADSSRAAGARAAGPDRAGATRQAGPGSTRAGVDRCVFSTCWFVSQYNYFLFSLSDLVLVLHVQHLSCLSASSFFFLPSFFVYLHFHTLRLLSVLWLATVSSICFSGEAMARGSSSSSSSKAGVLMASSKAGVGMDKGTTTTRVITATTAATAATRSNAFTAGRFVLKERLHAMLLVALIHYQLFVDNVM